jgi:hypothetical protein
LLGCRWSVPLDVAADTDEVKRHRAHDGLSGGAGGAGTGESDIAGDSVTTGAGLRTSWGIGA